MRTREQNSKRRFLRVLGEDDSSSAHVNVREGNNFFTYHGGEQTFLMTNDDVIALSTENV